MAGAMETVGDLLAQMDGVEPSKPKGVEPFVPATLPDAPKLPPPGIYFGMPEDEYHALPALSNGGVKSILASPMQYWANATWLSEVARKREKRERENPKTQVTRTVGKAYHCRLLEGADEYAKRFARELTPEDCEGALESTAQIKAAIEGAGAKPVSKVPDVLPNGQAFERPARKEDWVAQLLDLDPSACVLDVLKARHFADNDGKAFVTADAHEQIEIAAKMVEADPECRHAFKGGYPEVTLIWHCRETGVPMKARVDRLKMQVLVDLKTIAAEGRSLDMALAKAIAAYKYNIQPAVYLEGVEEVRRLVRENGRKAVWSDSGSGPEGAPSNAEAEWAIKWAGDKAPVKWLWIFQAKGPAPVTRGKFYPVGGMNHAVTLDMVRIAKGIFKRSSEAFGTDPWLDVAPVEDLADEDIPNYSCEI